MLFELWQSKAESSFLYLARAENYEKSIEMNKKMTPDLELIWTCEAATYFEAMQAYHQHMGWEPYKPGEDWEDIIYDE